ncbi:MAG: hypothetical protein ABI367_15520 [Mucilaginibacter sp.]
MNRLLILYIVFMLIFSFKAKSDIIIINGKTFPLTSESPLNKYPLVKTIKEKLVSYRTTSYDDPCDSYNAEWTVVNNELYLINIYSCNDTKFQHKTDLTPLFNDGSVTVKNGMVKAVWFKGDIWAAQGKPIYTYTYMSPVYAAETRVVVLNGKVTGVKEFVYPFVKDAVYNEDSNARTKFINDHINWLIIPNLKSGAKRINIVFQPGKLGKPENISLFKPSDDKILNDEAIRVIGLMPWNAYYSHGQIIKQPILMSVLFSEDRRPK